jgi:hypothetical protein
MVRPVRGAKKMMERHQRAAVNSPECFSGLQKIMGLPLRNAIIHCNPLRAATKKSESCSTFLEE